jgi:hypothetical protein
MADIDDTIDLYCVDDFLPTMPAVSGRVALAQRLCRRLTTRRGQIPWWPEFGYDIRNALLSKQDPQRIAAEVEAECEKDEQVLDVRAKVTIEGTSATLLLFVADADGPFEFTLTISQAAVQLSGLLETN